MTSKPANPEMCELKVQSPKDKNPFIQAILASEVECSSDNLNKNYHKRVSADQNKKFLNEKQLNIRDLIGKMRQKDFEQAIALEEKIALHLKLLLGRHKSFASAEQLNPRVNEFLSGFETYRVLELDVCDPNAVWKRTLAAVQETSHLASSLYTAAIELPRCRSFGSISDRQSEVLISPTQPKRAATFGGFDKRRTKANYLKTSRDAVMSTLSPEYFSNHDQNEERQPADAFKCESVSCNVSSNNNPGDTLENNNYAALQASHNLHNLLWIILQQMTTIQSLQGQLKNFRDKNPKKMFSHSDQLEELRNLQDRLEEEKMNWTKIKVQQEKEIEESLVKQKILRDQIKMEQQDIQDQRDQLYRKMEILSNQGLLISPNVAILVNPIAPSSNFSEIDEKSNIASADDPTPASRRRSNRWKPATAANSNLAVSPKVPTRQQLPLKLSSLRNAKSSSNVETSTTTANISQMLPLKLADKKNITIKPNHSRTSSSPAIIQQQFDIPVIIPATRTNTHPKFPESYRFRRKEETQAKASVAVPQEPNPSTSNKVGSVWLHASPKAPPDNNLNNNELGTNENRNEENGEEEVIYF